MLARNEAIGQVEVAAQLGGVARLARIVPGGRDAARQCGVRRFEAGHVVALPAVQAERDLAEGGEGLVGVHAQGGIALAGKGVGGFFFPATVGHINLRSYSEL